MTHIIQNLGEIEVPLLIFGGPYSNLAATQVLINLADQQGFARQHIICTGDVVAYCAEPEQTCQHIMQSGIHVVKGNCEESLATESDDCGCGFEPGMTCSILSDKWYRYAKAQVSVESRTWMDSLPTAITFEMNGYACRVIHGGVTQTNRFIFFSTEVSEKAAEMAKAAHCDIIIAGHSGIPFGQTVGKGAWLNAGVIGLPANDGTPDGWFMTLHPDDTVIRVNWQRLAYPYQQSHQNMVDVGLNDYADCLVNGHWPSLDILPDAEQASQGIALSLKSMTLPQ